MHMPRLLCLLLALTTGAFASDAPRIPAITIDGSLADWAGRGLLIENLASLDGQPTPPANLSARARLGWDDEGALFAIEVDDNVIKEAAIDLYTADSVEFFIARAVGGDDRFQVLLAPGINPPHAGPRIALVDRRKNKGSAPRVDAARTATATGYILECRIPWQMLGWTTDGTFGVQVIVNDTDHGADRLKWVWHPGERSSTDSRQLNEVRFVETAGPAERTFWRWNSLGAGRLAVIVSSTETSAQPRQITARENDRLVAQVALLPQADGSRSEFIVPARGEDIVVSLNDQPLGVIPLKSAERPNQTQINRTNYALTPAVFSGDAFPMPRLSKLAEIEKLLGSVTITARYFDAQQQEVSTPSTPGRYGIVYDIKPSSGPAIRRYQTLFKLPREIDWRTASMEFDAIKMPREAGLDPTAVSTHLNDLAYLFNESWGTQLVESPDAAMVLAAISEANPAAGSSTEARNNAWRRNRDWWDRLRKKLGDWEQYDYVVHTPEGYDADRDKRWPLVLFLHGSGDGENRQILKKWGPPRQIAQGRKFPFILLAPRSPSGPWQSWHAPQLGELLDEIEAKYRVDKDRIYVTGLSMGGSGTWRLAEEFPDRFAAIAPFCGGANETDTSRIVHIPTWAFHGDQDKAVPVEYTLRKIEALKNAGGHPRLTLYRGVGHVCWEEAYGGQEFYDWLLAQRRGAPPTDAAPAR